MEQKFFELWKRIGAKSDAQTEYLKLKKMYCEPNRFYHNLRHIKNLLEEADSARYISDDQDLIEIGIWYHDAVYNTKAKDNEKKSAEYAYVACIEARLPKEYAKKAKELVLATKHDLVPPSIDSKIMVDIDLSILGKNKEIFEEYEKNIEKEYFWIPEEKFRKGRKSKLKEFLDRESIYLTDFFRDKYEVQARRNIEFSINNLNRISAEKIYSSGFFEQKINKYPDAGTGLFNHWVEDNKKEDSPDVGSSLFDHWREEGKKESIPDAGIGLFNHWLKDD